MYIWIIQRFKLEKCVLRGIKLDANVEVIHVRVAFLNLEFTCMYNTKSKSLTGCRATLVFNFTGIFGVVCCPKNLKWLL
jgi:hypothetical protein